MNEEVSKRNQEKAKKVKPRGDSLLHRGAPLAEHTGFNHSYLSFHFAGLNCAHMWHQHNLNMCLLGNTVSGEVWEKKTVRQ